MGKKTLFERCGFLYGGKNFFWKVIYSVLYMVGIYYTVEKIGQNISRYLKYPSIISQREDVQVFTFPKITLCPYQSHSWRKVQALYPMVNRTVLKAFYGYHEKSQDNFQKHRSKGALNFAKEAWKEFESINVKV